MATSLTLSTPSSNNPTTKAMEDEAKSAVELKSKKGRKPTAGKAPYQKKQPQRGMGVAQLERLRTMSESRATTTTTQFPSERIVTNVPRLHGVANYGVPMMINGGIGGSWGWGDTAGLVMQRVVGNGGFGGLNGQVLVGTAPGNDQVGYGGAVFRESSKELSSMPKSQHSKPDGCDICFKKKHCNGENVRFNGVLNQFGQVLPIKEEMHVFGARAAGGASAFADHMNINQAVDVVAFGSSSVVKEYEFFPVKTSRSTYSKAWEFPAEASVAVDGESSHANASNCVDLSLKLSY